MTEKNIVFIVEDDPAQQKMLKVHFEQMLGNYEVRTFPDPREMLKHLDEKPYAIVLDHFFEDRSKTGLDYLAELRKTLRHVPVIYHTSLVDEKVRKRALELGAVEYIVKDSASLVRLRTVLDILKKEKKPGFLGRLFK